MKKRFSAGGVVIAALFLLLWAGASMSAPVLLDVDEAKISARREDREAIEGIWSVYQNWDPMPGQAQRYRLAIVKNEQDVFKEAKYLGVVVCRIKGVVPGEVKLLISPTAKKDEYQAVWRTAKGDARGAVRLEADETGTADSVLDLRELEIEGNILVKWLTRVPQNK